MSLMIKTEVHAAAESCALGFPPALSGRTLSSRAPPMALSASPGKARCHREAHCCAIFIFPWYIQNSIFLNIQGICYD